MPRLAQPSSETLAKVRDPELWRAAVRQASQEALDSSGGARSWHARAAQRASSLYRKRGGTWKDPLTSSERRKRTSLGQWQEEEWVTLDPRDGAIAGPCGTPVPGYPDARCLPRARAERLSKRERKRTARRKAEAPTGRNVSVMGLSSNEFILPCSSCSGSDKMAPKPGFPVNQMRASYTGMDMGHSGCGCGCGGQNACPCGCGGCGECRGQYASHSLGMARSVGTSMPQSHRPSSDGVSTLGLLGVVGLGVYGLHLLTRNFAR